MICTIMMEDIATIMDIIFTENQMKEIRKEGDIIDNKQPKYF
jgi:hypothetical protein